MSKVAWRRTATRVSFVGVVALVVAGALSLFSFAATPNADALKILHEADAAKALAAGVVSEARTAPAPVMVAQNSSRNAVRIDPIRSASPFRRTDAGVEVEPNAAVRDLAADETVPMLDRAADFDPTALKKVALEPKAEEPEKPGDPSPAVVNAGTYAFTASSGVPLENMSSGTTVLLTADLDDTASTVTPIGFEFWYDGVRQTLFSVNANGLVKLGVSAVTTAFTNGIATTTNHPQICPYWDDLWIGNNGRVHYKVVGSAPNRRLVIEWNNEQIPRVATATSGAGTFQAWLYESTGAIQFVYGSGMAANATNTGYTVGLATGATSFAAVTTLTNTVSYAAANDTQTDAIPSGTSYTFTPNAPLAPSGLSFTAVGLNAMTLNWADNATNEVGYAIYRSVDGTNYDFVGQTAAGATSSVQAGLASNTTWFWRVVAVTEGGLSTALSGSQATTTGTVVGTSSVGPTGTFASLTAAVASINTNGLAGNVVLELQAAYVSGVETFPLVINTLGSPSNTITIRPEAGAVARSITSASATATIDLNTATNVIIDGRAGGAGPSELSIANTAVGSVALRLINGASRNTVQFTSIQGVNTSTTGGVVLFSTTTGVTGNNNNTIDNCDVRDGATTSVNGITSIGTSSTTQLNTGNTISNSNIFNFFSAGSATRGILVTTNTNLSNTGWTITNNRIFQTAARNYTTTNTHVGIQVSGGSDYNVSNNTIGFANAGGTGTYTMTSTAVATGFAGVVVTLGDGANTVSGNTVAGISLGTTTGALTGVSLTAGSATISGNTVGSGTGTGSVALTSTSGTTAFIVGMNVSGTAAGSVAITSNTIGSLTATGSGTINVNINGMQPIGGALSITNNLIGSNATPNSIQVTSTGVSATAQQLIGMIVGVTMPTTISGNTIANLTHAGTGTAHVTRGLQYQAPGVSATASPGTGTIQLNSFHDISGAAANTTVAGGGTAVQALIYTAASPFGASIDQNTISAIIATNAGAVATTAAGIGYSNPSNGTVTRNSICDIRNASTGVTATAPPMGIGILIRAALGAGGTFSNNMISLGNAQATNTQFVGIMNSFNTAAANVFYNSVNITGAVGAGALPTYGFLRGDNSAASAIATPVSILNNIFNNARTGGTGKHYAIGNVNTTPATGWGASASNANVLNSPVAATVGIWGLAADQTFAGWQGISGGDGSSLSGVAIPFVSACDLHVNFGVTPTPIESHGVTIPGLAIDYDNQTRPGPAGSVNGGATAPDLGADEFDGVPGCSADSQCSDGNPCTDDTCDLGTAACVYTNDDTNTCSDGNGCTSDACVSGSCVGTVSVFCDDLNPCTNDACNPATGLCVFTGNTNPCNDNNICTTNDACGPVPTPVSSENFDGVTAPALPAGWSTATTGAGIAWVTSGTTPDTAPNSAFGADAAATGTSEFVSPPVAIATPSAKLTFRQRYQFEGTTTCFDGGVLEVKIGAGAFTDFVTAGGTFSSGGYNATLSSGNPLGARPGWCFASTGYPAYLTTVANLPASSAGQTLQFRWRIGSDVSVATTGQNIDSISITDTNFQCVGGPPLNCDDLNPCTADSCDPPINGCQHVAIPAGGSCSDGNPCNGAETCDAGGVCQPGTPITCDDLLPCTDDGCVVNVGCVYTPDNTNTCTDNNVCTTDSCVAGVCVGNPNANAFAGGAITIQDNQAAAPYPSTITIPPTTGNVLKVEVLLNGLTHTFTDDIDILLIGPTGANAVILSDAGGGAPGSSNVNLVLDDAAATAVPDTGTGLVSGTFKPFNYDTASDPFTGAPAHGTASVLSTFIGTDPSGDWNLYVWDDVGQDVGTLGSWSLRIAVDCDDNNPCTNDSCDPILGCQHLANANSCDDGDLCTQTDTCSGGVCVGSNPIICTQSDDCHQVGTCTAGVCSNPNQPDGTSCDDGIGCTSGETCTAGTCGGGTPNPPGELVNARFTDKVTFLWDSVPNGPAYDVLRGELSALPVGPAFGDEFCFNDGAVSSLTDVTTPGPGIGFWYNVRAANFCGQGGYGTQKDLTPRSSTTCP